MTDVSAPSARGALSPPDHKPSQSRSQATSPTLNTDVRPTFSRSPNSNPNFQSLPPLTTQLPRPRATSRVQSFVGKRVSTLSTASNRFPPSRPQSNIFPNFHSSLPYTLVRDFAYETTHPLHYGPSTETLSPTPSATASDFTRRLSDPEVVPLRDNRTPWSGHPNNGEGSFYSGQQLPALAYGDGPPWMEDADLLSPIVTSSRHRKTLSEQDYFSSRARDRDSGTGARRTNHEDDDEDQRYYDDHDDNHEGAKDTEGDEDFTYPHSASTSSNPHHPPRKGSVFRLPPTQNTPMPKPTAQDTNSRSSSLQVLDPADDETSRYSRDYSFSIASPDEEMHGKAIALFDFESENNNELPLVEGQVLWISYRHGQGWLVAKDPSTGEDGLVPEAYVRLEREIQGGFGGLNGQVHTMVDEPSPVGPETPRFTSPFGQGRVELSGSPSSSTGQVPQYPVVSHFTTSSRDLLPREARSPAAGPAASPSGAIGSGSGLSESTLVDEGEAETESESDLESASEVEGEGEGNRSPDTPQQPGRSVRPAARDGIGARS